MFCVLLAGTTNGMKYISIFMWEVSFIAINPSESCRCVCGDVKEFEFGVSKQKNISDNCRKVVLYSLIEAISL